MSVHGGTVRDDRAWPRGAGVFSVLLVLAALGAAGWAIATASRGAAGAAVVAAAFPVAVAGSVWLFRRAFDALIAGARQPAGSASGQLVLVLAGLAALWYDVRLGTAALAGVFGGLFATNLWAIRRARRNRAAVDAQEAAAEEARARARAEPDRRGAVGDSRPARDVGSVLDAAWRDVAQRWVAWLVAGAVVTGGTMLLTDSGLAELMVPFLAVALLLWVSRAAWSVGLARRDFRLARTAPERAWVVLLRDPTPRTIRPLLGVWSEEPVVRDGAFPRPDLVFRCDEDLDDLLSHQGALEVHEAWVDTGRRGMRGSRWVVADAGVALPHRSFLVFGRWFFASLTRAERPGPARPLTTARPDPAAPRDPSAAGPGGGRGLVNRLSWRVGGLVAVAVGCALID